MLKARRLVKKTAADDPAATIGAPPQSSLCITGIGASAGGFAAIEKFLAAMPAQSCIAFIIIQHFDAAFKSQAAELFARRTPMAVTEATDGVKVEPNHVYTIPSDKEVTLSEGCLRLHAIERSVDSGLHLPIDRFFHSLGNDQKERAIAIVLSGTGCDGTQGIKTIKANGGLVLAQQPETAQYDGMPRSAIATGLVDYVLPVEQMPDVLIHYAEKYLPLVDAGEESLTATMSTMTLDAILALLKNCRGFDFAGYKQKMLLRRIQRRMVLQHIASIDDYFTLLQRQPQEIDALYSDLMIGVTAFFRDTEAWDELRTKVVEPLVEQTAHGETIRAWVAGTSTGEEAYSLAMLLLDTTQRMRKRCLVTVFGTDTNSDALAIARAGVYPISIATQIPPTYLQRYFSDTGNQQFKVSTLLRESVVFGQQNLLTDPPYSRVDLVSCRNLLIYLDPAAQKRIILLAHFALRPMGYLFLGSAETIGGRDDLFKAISQKWRIYQRTGVTPYKQLDVRFAAASGKHQLPELVTRQPKIEANITEIAQRLLLENFAPAAALVNSKHEVIYFWGTTERFLLQPKGTPTQDLLLLARQGLRSHLRKALRSALLGKTQMEIANARVRRGAIYEAVKLSVLPTGSNDNNGPLFLVVFESQPATESAQSLLGPDESEESVWVKHLEDELRVTKDELQSTIEHLEQSNEDLKISNEEVVSINEELQSVNEELESSKEELQSLNEELSTVNQQLQNKVTELEIANNDLNNLIAGSDIAVLCLDQHFCIKWFTPTLRAVFKLSDNDIGRSISDFSSTLSGETLTNDAREVIKNLAPSQLELPSQDGRWYLRRILPYRLDDQKIEGVIITFTDITISKQAAEKAIAESEKLLASLESRVEERTAQLRALAFDLTKSEEKERQSIARDLHDGLGQNLALAKLKLDYLRPLAAGTNAEAALTAVEKMIDLSNQSLRSLATQLCPPILYDLGLMPALKWLADEMYREHGLHIHVVEDDQPKPLDQSVQAILFRAVRELLINVTKHADASTVSVDVSVCVVRKETSNTHNASLKITVSDNGKGFVPEAVTTTISGGFGLLNVHERIGYIGGNTEIVSAPGYGTTVTLSAPMSLP